MREWYEIANENEVDSPALLVYPERIQKNIATATGLVQDISCLRPHVKTHKMAEVTQMLLAAGISKFKCATIAEAEMVAQAGARDVLLAYQPTKPKAARLLALSKAFPEVNFSCLIDNKQSVQGLAHTFEGDSISVFLDLNIGMNRTGVKPENALDLYQYCSTFDNIKVAGLHAYDGHIHDTDLDRRTIEAAAVLAQVTQIKNEFDTGKTLKIVMGGTPTFPIYARQEKIETSPGTFVFWDEGYLSTLPDLPFEIAAVLLMRIISIIDENILCLDLGHKSVASENPFPRVKFLNVADAQAMSHSEEHLVVRVADTSKYHVGEVWYGIPYHICPTVALYDSVFVVENEMYKTKWEVIARNRTIKV